MGSGETGAGAEGFSILEAGMVTTDEPGVYIEEVMVSVQKTNLFASGMKKTVMASLCGLKC
ncbi:MAG: hypothetical protein ACLSFZ_08370 [Frisingicoccus sp.]